MEGCSISGRGPQGCATCVLYRFAATVALVAALPCIAVHHWPDLAARAILGGWRLPSATVMILDRSGSKRRMARTGSARLGDVEPVAAVAGNGATIAAGPGDAPAASPTTARQDGWIVITDPIRGELMIETRAEIPSEYTSAVRDAIGASIRWMHARFGTLPQEEGLGWLSPRESDVLHEIAMGQTVREAADALGLSVHTAHDYLKQVHVKTGCATRGELVAAYYGSRAAVADHS